jgi:hypothetical protein
MDRSGVESLQLAVDISNATVVKELPALLPALTHLRGVTIAADADVPSPHGDVIASARAAAPGWAPLAASLLQKLPQLVSVDLRLPLVVGGNGRTGASNDEDKEGMRVLVALAACTGLTALTCCGIEASELAKCLPAVLAELTALECLSLVGRGSYPESVRTAV